MISFCEVRCLLCGTITDIINLLWNTTANMVGVLLVGIVIEPVCFLVAILKPKPREDKQTSQGIQELVTRSGLKLGLPMPRVTFFVLL